MLSEEEKFLIEQYIDNTLSEGDRKVLNEKLKLDVFQRELNMQQSTATAINDIYREDLKKELKQLLKESHIPQESEIFSRRYSWYAAAAVISLTVLASYFFFKTPDDPESVFLAYYSPYPATAITRGPGPSTDFVFQKYAEKEYQMTADSLETIMARPINAREIPRMQLVLGNCYLNLDRTGEALSTFKKVMECDDAILVQHARWYYALTLIRSHEPAKAREILISMNDSNSLYHVQAKKLLQAIENM